MPEHVPHLNDDELDEHDEEHPPLPGSKDHVCTDLLWLLILVVCLGGLVDIQCYAYVHGDMRQLSRGFDVHGQLCGVAPNVSEEMYIYWCRDPDKYGENVYSHPVCLNDCPETNLTVVHECGFKDEDFNGYPTRVGTGAWCLPADQDRLKVVTTVIGNGTASALLSALRDAGQAGQKVWITTGVNAVLTGYLYLYILDKAAKVLLYGCEFVLVFGSWGFGGYLVYVGLHGGEDSFVGSGDETWDFAIGFALLVVGLMLACFFCRANKEVGNALGCVEAACECLLEEPSLLLEPFVSLLLRISWLCVLTGGLTHLASTGEVKPVGNFGVRRHIYYSPEQYCYLGAYIFMSIWILEMCSGMSQYVLAWTTQTWYFTPYNNEGQKESGHSCGIFLGYCNAVRYHLGTIAFGSFLIAFVQVFRVLLSGIAECEEAANPVLACVASCCCCCITCYRRFLEFITKNAYMDVALTSSSFCTAGRRALKLLNGQVEAVKVLNGTQFVFKLCGVGLVGFVGGFLVLMATKHLRMFNDPNSPSHVKSPAAVAIVACVEAAIIGMCFMNVFDIVGDTILYCFASERKRHKNMETSSYSAAYEMPCNYNLACWAPRQEVEEDTRVDYAPKKLKKLMDGM